MNINIVLEKGCENLLRDLAALKVKSFELLSNYFSLPKKAVFRLFFFFFFFFFFSFSSVVRTVREKEAANRAQTTKRGRGARRRQSPLPLPPRFHI